MSDIEKGTGGGPADLLRFVTGLVAAESVEDLVDKVFAGVHLVFGPVAVGFDFLDPHTHRLRSSWAQGVSSVFLSRYERVARAADPVLRQAIESRNVAYNLALMSESEWREHAVYRDVFALHGMTHVVCAPVVVDGRVVGTFNLGRDDESGVFTDAELDCADQLARQLGSIVVGLQARERLERELRLFRAALDVASDAVVVNDLRCSEAHYNRAAHAVLDELPVDGAVSGQARGDVRGQVLPMQMAEDLIERAVTLADDDARIAVLRAAPRAGVPPDWLRQRLTPRELDVVALAAGGLRDQEIADRLHLSVHTVKGYLRESLRKTGARSRVDLARIATSSDLAEQRG